MTFASGTLSGTISKDPEQRYTPNNISVVSFTLSILKYDGRSKEEKSYPVKVNLWGDAYAEKISDFYKGRRLMVAGRLQLEQFTDKTGKKVRLLCLEANKVSFLDELAQDTMDQLASTSQANSSSAPQQKAESDFDPTLQEEVPF